MDLTFSLKSEEIAVVNVMSVSFSMYRKEVYR